MGSPPRVRGNHASAGCPAFAGGITPACAGKTSSDRWRCCSWWDHPRVCGENSGPVQCVTDHQGSPRVCGENPDVGALQGLCEGSPPRVRGKPSGPACPRFYSGITPACAGKTILLISSRVIPRDHPRVCGENPSPLKRRNALKGSPPRVRGKPATKVLPYYRPGITPACVGKT